MGDGERPEVFLQWKGTDACLDFWCTCDADLHFDGYFAKELTCGHCGQTWLLPHTFTPTPVEPASPLTLVFSEDVMSPEPGAEFEVRWPRPKLDGAKPGDIVTVSDESLNCQRAVYADLLKTEPASGALILRLRTRGPV